MIRRPPRSTLFPYRRSSDLAPAQGDEAEPLLATQVQRRPPPVVHQVGGQRRRADRVGEVRDVGNRELGLRLDGGLKCPGVQRVVIENAILTRVRPGDGRPDVVHADPELERARNPNRADVTANAVTQLVTGLRVLAEAAPIERDRGRAAEEGGGRGGKAAEAVHGGVPSAQIIVHGAAEVDAPRRVAPNAAGIADGRREPALYDSIGLYLVGRVVL